MSYVETLTFRIDFVWDETGTKDKQSYEVEIVPDLNMWVSRPDIPITHPAWPSSIPSGYWPLKKYIPLTFVFTMSGTSIVYPVSLYTFLGFAPMTKTSCYLLIFPEKTRAKPRTLDYPSIPKPSPL